MLTWTDQPYSTMWAHLRLLSHEQNARRLLQNNMGGARTRPTVQSILLDQKAAQLSYCVLQAYEYYQAAESVTINTSPLLYFYGMLSLAKATIIANDPDKLLDDIRFHGLQHDKARRANTVEDQVAILNGGVFDDFINVVAGFRFPRGATFGFKVVLSISPELSNMYERYYPEKARCMYLYNIETLSKDPYKLRVRPQVRTKEEAYARIPELANDFGAEAGVHDGQAISHHLETDAQAASRVLPRVRSRGGWEIHCRLSSFHSRRGTGHVLPFTSSQRLHFDVHPERLCSLSAGTLGFSCTRQEDWGPRYDRLVDCCEQAALS
jgi:YaaC-like Protein